MTGTLDVAVIGSGLGSLTCAVELARQGARVQVFEQHRAAGGYARCFERQGYSFDVSLHHIGGLDPGCMTRGILAGLGVLERLELRRRPELFHVELPGFSIDLPNDREAIVDQLSRLFPTDEAGLRRLFELLPRLKADVIGPTMVPGFDRSGPERLSARTLDSTFGELLAEHLSDRRLLALLGQLWMQVGLPPSRSSANFTTCVFSSSFLEGAYSLGGGGQALSSALVERLRELGGACQTRCRVRRVLVEDGAAVGVELAGGETRRARVVVSGIDPFQTFTDLLPESATSRIFRYRISQMEPSLSFYSLYLGLDRPPSALGVPFENAFFNDTDDLDEAYRRCLAHELDGTSWALTSSEGSDRAAAPPSCGVLCVVEPTPARDWLDLSDEVYRQRKVEVGTRLLDKVLRRFPDLAAHLAVQELATPRTMHRYTANHGGAAYGFAQTVEQSNSRRLRNRTPLRGLFLTGAWTWAGGGYEGAMATGVQSAAAVLDDLGLERRAPALRLAAREAETPSVVDLTGRYVYRLPARVYNTELGLGGAIDGSSCLRLMDRGRVEAIEVLCRETDTESWLTRFTVNVYRLDARFDSAARLGDRLEVQSLISQRSSHRAAFDHRIIDPRRGVVIGDATVEVSFIGRDGELAPVPAEVVTRTLGDHHPLVPAELRFTPRRLAPDFPHRHRYRVYFEDTDTQSIAYHVSYVRYCEWALLELLDELGLPVEAGDGRGYVQPRTTRLTTRYTLSAKLGEVLEVQSLLRESEPGRALLEHRLVLADAQDRVTCDVLMEVELRDRQGRPLTLPRGLTPPRGGQP